MLSPKPSHQSRPHSRVLSLRQSQIRYCLAKARNRCKICPRLRYKKFRDSATRRFHNLVVTSDFQLNALYGYYIR